MVLTNTMARHPRQIWNFLKKESIAYAQFIPCLAPLDCEAAAPYALDSWRLGNLSQAPLKEIYESPQMSAFRSRPKDLPTACASCPYTRICGGCPRMRREVFCSPKNKFCGYRPLLDAILPRLQLLARSLKP